MTSSNVVIWACTSLAGLHAPKAYELGGLISFYGSLSQSSRFTQRSIKKIQPDVCGV